MSKASTPYIIAGASPDIISPPGGWSPADITGIKLWLRSDRNVTLNGGGKLTSIKNSADLSHIFSIPSPLSVPLDYDLAKYPDGGSRQTINFRGENNVLYDGSCVWDDEEEDYIWVPSVGHELLFDYRNDFSFYMVFKPTVTPDGSTRHLWSTVQMGIESHRGVYSQIVGGSYHRLYATWPWRVSNSSDNNKWATNYWAIIGGIASLTVVGEYYQTLIAWKALPVFTTSIPQEPFSSFVRSSNLYTVDVPSEDGVWIGGSHRPASFWTFYGELAELIISEGAMSESDEAKLQDYLRSGI